MTTTARPFPLPYAPAVPATLGGHEHIKRQDGTEDPADLVRSLVLHTRTGVLTYRTWHWGATPPVVTRWSGRLYTGDGWKVDDLAEELEWRISTNDPRDGVELAKAALPHATTFLAHLYQVGDIRDVTAEAATAADDIQDLCTNPAHGPLEDDDRIIYIDAADHMTTDLITPREVDRPTDELDMNYRYVQRTVLFGEWDGTVTTGGVAGRMVNDPTPAERYERTYGPRIEYTPEGERMRVTGAVAWVQAYRQWVAGDLVWVDASEWFASNPPPECLTADTTDSEIPAVVDAIQAAATPKGVKVAAATSWVWDKRRALRDTLRKALEEDGRTVKRLEGQLRAARARRSSRLMSVISWGGVDSDADLGRLAGMSRQGVQQLRERLVETEAENTAE